MTEYICPSCHKEMPAVCPVEGCGKPVEVYSRIVGYLRPVRCWNPGKVEEMRARKEYILGEQWHQE